MADEPYMRFQRAQQMLGGLGGFLPTYTSGYGTGMQSLENVREPSGMNKFSQAVGPGGDWEWLWKILVGGSGG